MTEDDFCRATGKRKYVSSRAASRAMKGIQHRRNAKPHQGIVPHHCNACGQWHLGRNRQIAKKVKRDYPKGYGSGGYSPPST